MKRALYPPIGISEEEQIKWLLRSLSAQAMTIEQLLEQIIDNNLTISFQADQITRLE